ncbi:protein of unknown function DUF3108 [Citrifermentans bemidjiense Bem]|uniref:DUF3108 domain-containing protein n=1 Tax=Citrifermentans bemidjiense (strain ATCC BAA-1014 / DSM 16622 / JCM 12645 / Bem) TaxID=404380 RepID=B5EFD6_CITBB|nr:DUF3108 domain-containing protein [Citrifermentans bemidjiense]ACH40891.2 protein of unknown function DUF3108 [Citrifermentans bemidjiense Bem]
MKFLALLIQSILLVAIWCSPAAAIGPERLVYDVSWSGLNAGTAVLEVAAQGDDFRILNTIASNSFVSVFFRIDDKTESTVSRSVKPKSFKEKISEGKFRAHREATFNFTTHQAESKDLLTNTVKRDAITARTYDNLSSIYFLRSLQLAPGQSISFEIYDTKHLWKAEAKVGHREEITTSLGKFKTIMVTSQLTRDGIPAKVGNPTFWFTDDNQHIPVRIKTQLKVGEITLTLAKEK